MKKLHTEKLSKYYTQSFIIYDLGELNNEEAQFPVWEIGNYNHHTWEKALSCFKENRMW